MVKIVIVKQQSNKPYVSIKYAIHICYSSNLKKFSERIKSKDSNLHLWAAGFSFSDVPEGWEQKHLTTPLRSPPVVLKEIMKQKSIGLRRYENPLKSDTNEGPKIIEIDHQSHTGGSIKECVECGREIGKVLYNLRKGILCLSFLISLFLSPCACVVSDMN